MESRGRGRRRRRVGDKRGGDLSDYLLVIISLVCWGFFFEVERVDFAEWLGGSPGFERRTGLL